MKNEYLKLLLLCFTTCAMVGCKKELNVFPSTQQVDGNVIVDAKSAATVLNGVYYRFADAGNDNNGVPAIAWSGSHEVIPSELSGLLTYSYGGGSFEELSVTPQDPSSGVIWQYGYNLVNSANGFLKNVAPANAIPAAVKAQMIAEARFLRAFANAELLFYYGQYRDVTSKYGIVIRDEFVSSTNLNLPRATVAATYDFILADLDAAIVGLPSVNTRLHYTNVWVAKQLKARVLINRGSGNDYAQVISLTDDIIKNSPFELENQLKDLFLTKGFSSKEVMLSVQPFPTESFKFAQYQVNTLYSVTPAGVDFFLNDPRSAWYYKSVERNGGTYATVTKYYSGDVVNISQTPLSLNSYAFRLSEAYLLQAEAISLSGGNLNTAKTLLKTVMGHSGITDFSAVDAPINAQELQLLVVKEEMKNFFSENGLDWYALRRLPLATMKVLRPALKSEVSLILPIPLAERTANNKVEQNPGY